MNNVPQTQIVSPPSRQMPVASIVVTCKGRLHHLRKTLPLMLDQSVPFDFEIVVVDYGCPQETYRWCLELDHHRLLVVRVQDNVEEFNRSRARNCGANRTNGQVLAFVDADIRLQKDWLRTVVDPILADGRRFMTVSRLRHGWDCGGTWAVSRNLFHEVRGYDEQLTGWGGEDSDIYARCCVPGYEAHFSSGLIRAIKHDVQDRVRYHARKLLFASAALNSSSIRQRTIVNPGGYGQGLLEEGRGRRRLPVPVPSVPVRVRSSIRHRGSVTVSEDCTPAAIPSYVPLDFTLKDGGVIPKVRDQLLRKPSPANGLLRRAVVSLSTADSSGLAAVCCYFNPCHYRNRYKTYGQFAARIHAAKVPLLTVELALGDDPFELDGYPNVLRVRAKDVLWHKERLLNIGIERLLDQGFRKIAWLDADIVFRNDDWPKQVSRTLDDHPVCQVFRTVFRQRERGNTFRAVPSSARDASAGHALKDSAVCPGFGWAATADTLNRGLLYDRSILGSGDALMFFASYCWPSSSDWELSVKDLGSINRLPQGLRKDYFNWASRWGAIVKGRLGFSDCEIVALYHGTIANRQYGSRDHILVNHDFDPSSDLCHDQHGCWQWNSDKPLLHDEVRSYFIKRAEDS